MSAKKKILIVEDEPQIVLGLTDALTFEGFEVVSADTGKGGMAMARTFKPDAVILDLMLPDTNGFVVCEQLRRENRFIPIIMLTARSSEADKIRGLDAGADDYVTKPFSIGELIARMRAIFRRAQRPADAPETFQIGKVTVNLATQTITRGKRTQQLSFYEAGLLRLLQERAGQPVSREEILQKVWGLDASPTNRTVDNFIVKLRKKC
ncbi:MAG TPA: response regulator transcription factor, partial [Polyangiaceae bacterium]|nr:response regulator transcription factor [Polyangiaceae bacterium]